MQIPSSVTSSQALGRLRAARLLRACFGGVFALGLVLSGVGCNSSGGGFASEQASYGVSDVLSSGDVIGISFPGAPDLNQKQKVRADGMVSLPMVGDIRAAGRLPGELESVLSTAYHPHLQVPETSITLEKAAAVVYVSGEVTRPGKVTLDRPMTAFEAIMESGGFTNLANPRRVSLVRNSDGKHFRDTVDLSDVLHSDSTAAVYLKPYDSVIVSQRRW